MRGEINPPHEIEADGPVLAIFRPFLHCPLLGYVTAQGALRH